MDKRKEKGWSQIEMTHKLNMEQSQYSRRKNGATRIMEKEWDKIAKILGVPLEEIYELHDGVFNFSWRRRYFQ
ncbi:MAG: helix-turn-helix domain-containing protein [Moheibacter sp.]